MLFSGVGRCLKARGKSCDGRKARHFPTSNAAGRPASLTHNPRVCSACSSGSEGYARRHSAPPGARQGPTESTLRPLRNQHHTGTVTNPLTAVIILLPRLTDPACRRLGPVPPRRRPEDPPRPFMPFSATSQRACAGIVELITPFTPRLLSPHSFMSPLFQLSSCTRTLPPRRSVAGSLQHQQRFSGIRTGPERLYWRRMSIRKGGRRPPLSPLMQ